MAPDEVSFAAEESWNDILQPRQGHTQFPKDPVWWGTQPGQAESILSAVQPADHARIKKVFAPGFTQRALQDQETMIVRYANLLIERLRGIVAADAAGAGEADMTMWYNLFSFDVMGDVGYGESFDCLETSAYHPWIALLFNSVRAASWIAAARYYPLLNWALFKCIPQSLLEKQREHFQVIVDKVDRRLNFEVPRPDVMAHVLKANDKIGMSPAEVNTNFMFLTSAGSETSATALSGTTNYLVSNPDKLATATEEVREQFRLESDFTLHALSKLPYLNAVLHEGLRLCPPIPWILPRMVPAGGDTVCGTWLPGGVSHVFSADQLPSLTCRQTRVSVQPWTINRDPDYFHEPTSFAPERWLPEASSDPASPFFNDRRQAIQPFSVGPRACLGQNLAWAEMRLALAKMLWTFDLEAVEGKRVRWEDLRTFLLVEKRPILVRMRLREGV